MCRQPVADLLVWYASPSCDAAWLLIPFFMTCLVHTSDGDLSTIYTDSALEFIDDKHDTCEATVVKACPEPWSAHVGRTVVGAKL